MTDGYVQDALRDIQTRLRLYGLDELNNILRDTGGLIAGSFPLQCFLGEVWGGDIDIHVNERDAKRFSDFMAIRGLIDPYFKTGGHNRVMYEHNCIKKVDTYSVQYYRVTRDGDNNLIGCDRPDNECECDTICACSTAECVCAASRTPADADDTDTAILTYATANPNETAFDIRGLHITTPYCYNDVSRYKISFNSSILIQIIIINEDIDILKHIDLFDFDTCKVFYDGVTIDSMTNYDKILQRQSYYYVDNTHILEDEEYNSALEPNIELLRNSRWTKYRRRGFTITERKHSAYHTPIKSVRKR